MSKHFPKPKSLGANVKVELDLSNYATKADLTNLKSHVDKLDIDKLKSVSTNLSKFEK